MESSSNRHGLLIIFRGSPAPTKNITQFTDCSARLYKALDKLEAVISHNESDLASWLPLEYELQLTYGKENIRFSEYLTEFGRRIDEWTREKIAGGQDLHEIGRAHV